MMDQSDSDILDYHVNKSDVQSLSSRDAVCAFFSHIGYNTEARIAQTPTNLGITASGVTRQIRHIERVADQDDSLQIYIFEVDSVTISLTRSLARTFRDFRGHFLLVITSDYERIDFVLVETHIPAGSGEAAHLSPTRKLAVRPRILTVERRKPTRVQLRVLNRFPYTEPDPYAQYDKLLSAYSVADWSEEFFNNRALFSDYYLKERLRDTDEWKEDPRPDYDMLQKMFSTDGSVLPVLKCLGFNAVEVDRQKKLEEPNYKLYMQGDDSEPVTVALTYPWNRSLDGPDETRDPDTPDENPGKVVVSILEEGETDWAIVTNGKIWRLYSRKTHSRATNYYEIDLEEVLAETSRYDSPGESFRYFWLLFRARAFQPFETVHEEEKRTSTFLDALLEGSRDYAKELGERLKERVFAQIFPHFASGFIQYIRDTEGSEADLSRERLDTMFHGTLALLYRLLFLLYSESRDLLPVKELRGYYEKSLRKLTQEISDAAGNIQDEAQGRLKKAYSVDSTELYDRLTKIFRVIDEGDARINVPCYNGSLFMTDPGDEYTSEAENARFLMKHKISDRYLAQGLDLMARDLDDKLLNLVFIDYKSLGVRQLGSIYEGLLEFKLEIAQRKLGIVKSKGKEVYVPFRELSEAQQNRAKRQEQIIKKGQVYLSNDKRERKATGSYYTPDYIVKYIVENTVGPVLEEKFDKMRPEFRKAEKDYRNAVNRQKKFQEQGMKGSDPKKVANTYLPVVNELFDLSILDPAMGSGHFLVEAVDFVTDKMITFLNAFPWNPVVAMLRETREMILESMSKQEITIDINRLTDVNLLKRHVLKRCVYGVDLNPMAVELAKVSLWLDCFTLGAPLSFLDHHLKCGHSLIGSRIETVRKEVESDLFGTQFAGLITATAGLIHVGELSDVTIEQVRESIQAFHDASHILGPFKAVLDLWTAQYFSDESDASQIRSVFLSGRFPQIKQDWQDELGSERIMALRSLRTAPDKRFFHWELEFPEVFFGPRHGGDQAITGKENPGFDIVIGNPPYVSYYSKQAKPLSKAEDEFHKKDFDFILDKKKKGRFGSVMFFLEKGMRICREHGALSYIIDMNIFENPYLDIRKYITDNFSLKEFVLDLVGFKGVTSGQILLRIEKCPPYRNSLVFKNSKFRDLKEMPQSDLIENNYNWRIYDKDSLAEKIAHGSELLVGLFPKKLIRTSITFTGKKQEFLVTDDNSRKYGIKSSNIYPLLEGAKAFSRPYEAPRATATINYDLNLVRKLNDEYRVTNKSDKNPMVIGFADLLVFTRPRILVRLADSRITATFTDSIACSDLSLYTISNSNLSGDFSKHDLKYILAILNSKLITYYALKNGLIAMGKKKTPQIRLKSLKILPIKMSDKEEPFIEIVDKILGITKSENYLTDITKQDQVHTYKKQIDEMVYELYDLTQEEIKLVENLGKGAYSNTENTS